MASQPRPRYQEALEIARDLWTRPRANVWRSPGLAAFSLLIGLVLWLVVTDAENPTRVDTFGTQIQVVPVNVSQELAVANSSLPTVQVRIEAPEDRWDDLTPGNFRAFVDLNDLDAREQLVPVQVEVNGISRVRVVGTTPSLVLINLEELQTKEVPVTTRIVGTPPRGYEPGPLLPERDTIEVSGPASLVSRVTEAAAAVNVTGLTVGLDQSVSVVPLAEGGGEIRGVTAEPETVAGQGLDHAVDADADTAAGGEITGEPAPGYRISGVRVTPATVQVEGTIDVLQALDTLRLPNVDVGGQTASMEATVVPSPPEGVTVVPGGTIGGSGGHDRPDHGVDGADTRARGDQRPRRPRRAREPRQRDGHRRRAIAAAQHAAARSGAGDRRRFGPRRGTTDVRVVTTLPDGVFIRQVQPATVSVTLAPP